MKKQFSYIANLMLVVIALWFGGCSSSTQMEQYQKSESSWINLDTVKAGKFDTGKMWTFDFPPYQWFKEAYNFSPTEEWMNNVRMSALRFANYCSASFVSEDGLVMTNHHCGRESITEVTKEGEDLHSDGFIAATLEDERKVPGLYVDQLVLIKDVTKEIQEAIDLGKDEQEKVANKSTKIAELQKKYKDDTGLEIQIVTLYNGGKYSLYGYKRYKDVRLVFAPETQLGFYGGDPDNFTYPRYALDCSFFRVYDEEGKPLKTTHFFKWSPKGAIANEPVFVVGNPGRTNRLNTVAQLEFQRDYAYPITMQMLNSLVEVYTEYLNENPDKVYSMQDQLFGYSNSQKAYQGILDGLRNPVLMAKKKDFEKNFKNAVFSKPELKSKYGNLWESIQGTRNELKQYVRENAAYNLNPVFNTQYFFIAKELITLANELKKPETERSADYKGLQLDSTIDNIFPADFDKSLNDKLLKHNIAFFEMLLGENNPLVVKFTGNKKDKAALEYCLNVSEITTIEKVKSLIKKGPDAILNSNDPFIYYVLNTEAKGKELAAKIKEINTREQNSVQLLGRAVFDVYGTNIPPDATFTLRIADGVVKGYNYNGTTAPVNTTFYGLYDRYYSFEKKFPWNLPKRWENPPAEFNLETPMVFVSTNDIIGGNSGSPVINKNAEVVGLAFDGNIESLPGQFIFDDTANRTVSVHSAGMLEAIMDLYKNKRLGEELKHGKITDGNCKKPCEHEQEETK